MKLYTYVIATDHGSAPNYDPPCTTLAICKPRIRRSAEVGDAILAFTGQALSPEPHAVCWAGVVSEKLPFADYWRDRRFSGKKSRSSRTPDNIYRPDGLSLQQVENPSHGPDDSNRDLGGRFVLICAES
jgi:Nucleotide modification associated domain 2